MWYVGEKVNIADFTLCVRIMGKFDKYRIDLKRMNEPVSRFVYDLDNPYFTDIDGSEVSKGKVHVTVDVKKLAASDAFELVFQLDGEVIVACDRCLDDMEVGITAHDKVMVKLGADYADDGEWVIIPEEEGDINVAWFMYEFIALALPMKHVHAPGKCNQAMAGKLNKHLRLSADEDMAGDGDAEDEDLENPSNEPDSRWNELKKILDNN